jgi:ADP-heptose:LPS heptosyltransferase/O-antigen/teichoic acid export membrane protein/thymidylate kinase
MISGKQQDARAKLALSVLVHRMRVDSLLRNSIYVMATTAVTAASGYLFWIIAARMYPAHEVGLASALIGTMTLSAMVANLGVGPALIQVLPHREDGNAWSLTLNAVLATSTLASLLIGSVAAIALPFLSPKFAIVGHHPGYTLALIIGVPLLSIAAVLDAMFTAERAAGNMLTRSTAFALLRIPLIIGPVLLGWAGALAICTSWILAAGASLLVGALLIPRLGRVYRLTWRGIVAQMRRMLSLVAGHQVISLGALAPVYLLPLLVVARLSPEQNAYFYTSWQVGSLFFMVSPAVAIALLVEGSHTPDHIFRKARSSALIIGALLCPAMLAAILGGYLILTMFGPKYALNGYSLLTVLVISAIPDAIGNIYVAVLRVRRQFVWAALLNLAEATLTLLLAWYLLPLLGIVGAGWAWLIAQTAGTFLVAAHLMVAAVRSRVGSRSRRTTVSTAAKRTLLIVDPCSAGEALRIAPYVTMVRHRLPDAQITLVANRDALAALERSEDIDRFVESKLYLYRPHSRVVVRLAQLWSWLGLACRLGGGYDLVITFYWGGVLQHLLGFAVGRRRRVGYAHHPRLLSRRLLSSALGPFKWTESHAPQHAALLRAAGVEADGITRPYISYTEDDSATVTRLLQERGMGRSDRLIVLHQGSDWACQRWLPGRWAELADALVTRYGTTIAFTGTTSEAEYVEDIRSRMRAPSHSLLGQTTLPQMAALLARSRLCICVDSAIFELTQATGTRAVALAGPSRPETGGYGASRPIVIRRMSGQLAGRVSTCQDSHNARNEPGCWNNRCWMAGLRDISVADVLNAADEQLRLSACDRQPEHEQAAHEAGTPFMHPMLEAVFTAFRQEGIRWCVLRGEAALARPSDDVDLLVAPGEMPRVRALLEAHQFASLPTWGRGSHAFFVGYHPPTETWITLDIVTELTYGPYLNLRAHAATGCLARRRTSGSLAVLAPDDAFWTLILHCLLDKGVVAPHRAARLRELVGAARTDGPLARLVAVACPSGWDTARLIECVRLGDWEHLAQVAPMLAAQWRSREPIRARGRAVMNHALQLLEIALVHLRRPAVSVALLGPDGAGKSTLAAEIQHSFYFPVRSVYMGLWSSGRARTGSAVMLHFPGMRLAGRGLEIGARLPRAWWQYLVGRVHQLAGRVVIFDRYVYDALIAAHQSSGLLKRLYMWLLGHSCPAPDLVLLLDVPGDVMFARKGENGPDVLEAQRQCLLALRDRIPHVEVVDATREDRLVRADVVGRIWAACRARWAK